MKVLKISTPKNKYKEEDNIRTYQLGYQWSKG